MFLQFPRGSVYWMNGFTDAVGCEQKGTRPVLIVSNNKNNMHSSIVNVVPITSSGTKTQLPTHVIIPSIENTQEENILLCEQVQSVSKKRLLKFCGILTPDVMYQVEKALSMQLGITPPGKNNFKSYEEKPLEKTKKEEPPKFVGYTDEYKKQYLKDAETMSNAELAKKYNINAKAASARVYNWRKLFEK